jgi:hypothetical protein
VKWPCHEKTLGSWCNVGEEALVVNNNNVIHGIDHVFLNVELGRFVCFIILRFIDLDQSSINESNTQVEKSCVTN